VELEGFLGYSLLSNIVSKDGDIVLTSFSNSVSSTIMVVDNKVELEAVDLGM
jgi:hypothetical protein